ncbi:MAG: ATP-dependent helicase [Spirochaetota bacterium]
MAAFPQLETLNPAQREAVLHTGGPLLILAGAGSGKTRVITVKIAYLIRELGVPPHSILAVTFTNKAAGEMRERAAAMEPAATDVMIRTFHSFGAWLLRRNAAAAGLDRGYSIYDDDDVVSLLRTLYPAEHRGTLARYARMISRAKDYTLRPDDDLSLISLDPDFAEIYRAYQERLDQIGNVDFGDLILKPVELLRSDEAIRTRIRQRFRYVLVDEYQDSNVAQYELLKQLSDEGTYLCVVGDDDQSIYRFRGAEVRNILTFSESFPQTAVVKLEQNYRSTGPILDVASAVVSHNAGRLGKTLWTERAGGTVPVVALLRDQDEEVDYCLDLIERDPRETAILYRTNAQSRLFESALLRAGVPYRIVGSVRFYEREEVKDALSVLKLCANPRDEISFRRIVNKPARGIGAKTLDQIAGNLGQARGDLLLETEATIPSLSKKASASARRFLDVIAEARSSLGSGRLSEFSERVLRELGLWDHHAENNDEITARAKVENLEEFVNAASLYPATEEGLAEFLELIELDRSREQDETPDAKVTLITMHNTKGLEFDRVIVTGLDEGLFPRGGNEDPDEIEEERRLFYVAVTRARDELYLTSCSYRRLHGRSMDFVPSRFIGEIPRELLEIAGDARAVKPQETNEYPTGAAVYHDDYGAGVVTRSWHNGSELVVQVQFESGRAARFLPRYTLLERIAGDL